MCDMYVIDKDDYINEFFCATWYHWSFVVKVMEHSKWWPSRQCVESGRENPDAGRSHMTTRRGFGRQEPKMRFSDLPYESLGQQKCLQHS